MSTTRFKRVKTFEERHKDDGKSAAGPAINPAVYAVPGQARMEVLRQFPKYNDLSNVTPIATTSSIDILVKRVIVPKDKDNIFLIGRTARKETIAAEVDYQPYFHVDYPSGWFEEDAGRMQMVLNNHLNAFRKQEKHQRYSIVRTEADALYPVKGWQGGFRKKYIKVVCTSTGAMRWITETLRTSGNSVLCPRLAKEERPAAPAVYAPLPNSEGKQVMIFPPNPKRTPLPANPHFRCRIIMYGDEIDGELQFQIKKGITAASWCKVSANSYDVRAAAVVRDSTQDDYDPGGRRGKGGGGGWGGGGGGKKRKVRGPNDRVTQHLAHEIHVTNSDAVVGDPNNTDFSMLTIGAFDIECVSGRSANDFPQPMSRNDLITNVSILIVEQTAQRSVIHSFGFALGITHATVRDILNDTAALFQHLDIMYSFNGTRFDEVFMNGQASESVHDAKDWANRSCFINHNLFNRMDEEKLRDSGIRGGRTVDVPQWWHLDLLNLVRKNEISIKSPTKTLKAVAEEVIRKNPSEKKLTKIDLPYAQQRPHFIDPNLRPKLQEYNIMDSVLLIIIAFWTNVLNNAIETMRLALVSSYAYINQGEQIKVWSKLCQKLLDIGWALNKDEIYEMAMLFDSPYEGGAVLEPKKGLWRWVACLDFNSLYPSLIIANNICYSSIAMSEAWVKYATDNGFEVIRVQISPGVVVPVVQAKFNSKGDPIYPSLLPGIERELLAERKKYKKEMANHKTVADEAEANGDAARCALFRSKQSVANARQLVLKKLSNSVYGFTGVDSGGSGSANPINPGFGLAGDDGGGGAASGFFGFDDDYAVDRDGEAGGGGELDGANDEAYFDDPTAGGFRDIEEDVRFVNSAAHAPQAPAASAFGGNSKGKKIKAYVSCPVLAKLITALGREGIMKSAKYVEDKYCCIVVYGDTDSIMIVFPETIGLKGVTMADAMHAIKEAIFKKGNDVGADISKTFFQKPMNLELEKINLRHLQVRKKGYAIFKQEGLKEGPYLDVKGLHTIRGDWCDFSKETGKEALIMLVVNEQPIEDVCRMLVQKNADLIEGRVPMGKLELGRNIAALDTYAFPERGAHTHLAMRLFRDFPSEAPIPGSRIKYLITIPEHQYKHGFNPKKRKVAECSQLTEHVVSKNMPLDMDYYWHVQVEKPMRAILEVMDPDLVDQTFARCAGRVSRHIARGASMVDMFRAYAGGGGAVAEPAVEEKKVPVAPAPAYSPPEGYAVDRAFDYMRADVYEHLNPAAKQMMEDARTKGVHISTCSPRLSQEVREQNPFYRKFGMYRPDGGSVATAADNFGAQLKSGKHTLKQGNLMTMFASAAVARKV